MVEATVVLIADRLAALDDAVQQAVAAGPEVLPGPLVEQVRALEHRAGERLRLSERHTVVAVAGATGSGKSSLVNALVGEEVATVDVLRPTTAHAMAVVHGVADAGPLLDWLEIDERVGRPDARPGGLVLVDMPDHDSVRTSHRLEAERLIGLVDLMVWVLDPQKYADAAVHERYLRTLAAYRDVLLVVLNQVDRLEPDQAEVTLGDVRRLLAEDGLDGVRVLPVSARTGAGVADLRNTLADVAFRHEAHRARLEADVMSLADRVVACCGTDDVAVPRADRALVDALALAAKVPTVVEAAAGSYRLSARLATGWPPTRWLARLRADPLHAMHLAPARHPRGTEQGTGRGVDRETDEAVARTSLPPAGPAERAHAAGAVRDWRDRAVAALPDSWALAARGADLDLADELDHAVASTPVVAGRTPLWWRAVGALQWLVLVLAIVGVGWLAALAGMGALRLPVPDPPRWGALPVPTALALGGALLGLLLAGVARLAAGVGARRAGGRAAARLHDAVARVADARVVAPVADVVARHQACRAAATRAAARARRREGR
ncbi:GTPase [Isoptericola sp. b490]|uniref:GTPase family protein n=1 Tax=Actinotalea lenta TaxID=3064654 RepID=UPI002712AA3B|nr:GTPase [Isoptericola sp. b490]MDO8121104.1 GTPase [Isoptericola sp. b490]